MGDLLGRQMSRKNPGKKSWAWILMFQKDNAGKLSMNWCKLEEPVHSGMCDPIHVDGIDTRAGHLLRLKAGSIFGPITI